MYVLDITVNFMLNKRKSKKAAGAKPQTPLVELSALPQTPLLSREGGLFPVPSTDRKYTSIYTYGYKGVDMFFRGGGGGGGG